MKQPCVTVIGGTGFLGRAVVHELVKAGYMVQVFSRRAHRNRALKPLSAKNAVVLRQGDITRPKTLQGRLRGSLAVINLVGVLYETRRQRFSAIHAQAPERLAKMAKEEGVKYFVHISALGADRAVQSSYARTKATGEKAVLTAFPEATILRPGVIFGTDDNFLNQFARMARIAPFLPLIGGGTTKFQPVYVTDVAKAIAASIAVPQHQGKIYELGGPEIFSFREILDLILQSTGRSAHYVPLPWPVAKLLGALGQCLPNPPLTRDQVRLLQHDNLVSGADGFKALGITPQPLSLLAKRCLQRHAALVPSSLPLPSQAS